LIALVMLPVTAMCGLAGSVVLSHRSAATQALAVDHGVIGLSELVALRDALQAQQSVEAFDVRFVEVGATRAAATGFLGFDWAGQVAPARAEASRAIASLGPGSLVSATTLQSLYAQIDGRVISPTEAAQRLDGFGGTVEDVMVRGLDGLEAGVGRAPLLNELESLRAATDLVDVAPSQGIDLSAVWFPLPGEPPQAAAAAVLTRLGAESADYAAAVARLRQLGVTSVVASLARIEADPQVHAFDQSVAASLLGKPLIEAGATLDTAKVAATFLGYFARDPLIDDLVTSAIVAVRDEARQLAASERAGFVAWALGGAALALASIGVALWLARSISKPLKDLAGYAHAVNEGQLDAEPSQSRNHGPRETRVAFGVFTDLVVNLQLLDAKANALAHCDFDDPVLSEPLPGRLGRSLESSVAVLSGSIVERDQLQTHLAHQATHDALTGISNRPAAITGIQAAMHRAARTGAATAVLFVDLNEFKAVNDSYGHEVGDEVLRQVANRISVGLRSGDFVARLGGDEFIVVAEGIAGVADATDVARRIIDTISDPIEIGAIRISIGAAVGIALTLDGPEEPLRLLARADAAMYRAKHHERSAIEIFDADLQHQMIEREDIETALTAALADLAGGGLQLHYQPVLDATSGALAGVEALIRWNRPGHGLLYPDSFIPIAEATALIIDIDCWVLKEATRQLVAWSGVAELAEVPVAVNISGRHLLSRQLRDHIRAVLDQTGVDPRRLSIEITETVLLTDLVAAAAELDAVRALGVRVAIDDFGTGYTSLAHLQQLPIDTIKIDRSFISQLNVRRGSSLVRMVTDLGHAIDINIVAEGVETDEEMGALQAIGADHLQGYLLSRPLQPAALSTWARGRVAAQPVG
jgi:diguanylate cyclase (GGDEF)-like protein